MATFMRFGGERGLNVDTLAEWTYSEKPAVKAGSRPQAPKDAPAAPEPVATEGSESATTPALRLTFTDGHVMEVEGEYATALHRYFRSIGSALT